MRVEAEKLGEHVEAVAEINQNSDGLYFGIIYLLRIYHESGEEGRMKKKHPVEAFEAYICFDELI